MATIAESVEARLEEVKEKLRSQHYESGAGIHVTSMENAVKIAYRGHIYPSELSNRVDVEIVQRGVKPNIILYKGDTNPAVIEIPPNKVHRGGEGGRGGFAQDQGKSYVTVDDAKFHTVDGVYDRQTFLNIYSEGVFASEYERRREEEITQRTHAKEEEERKKQIEKIWEHAQTEEKKEEKELEEFKSCLNEIVTAESHQQKEALRKFRRALEEH